MINYPNSFPWISVNNSQRSCIARKLDVMEKFQLFQYLQIHSQMASNYITCTKETMYLTIACNLWRPSQVLQPSNHTWFFRVVIAVTDSLPPSFSLFPFLNINFERGYLTKAITCNPLPIGWAPKYIPKNLDIECNSKNTNSKGDGLTVGYTITWSMFHI